MFTIGAWIALQDKTLHCWTWFKSPLRLEMFSFLRYHSGENGNGQWFPLYISLRLLPPLDLTDRGLHHFAKKVSKTNYHHLFTIKLFNVYVTLVAHWVWHSTSDGGISHAWVWVWPEQFQACMNFGVRRVSMLSRISSWLLLLTGA